MAYEIRELSVTGIFNQAIAVITDNFASVLTIVCIGVVPLGILQTYLTPAQADPFNPGAPVPVPDSSMLFAFAIVTFLGAIVGILTNAAIVTTIAEAYLGNKISAGAAFGRAAKKFFPLIWTWILVIAAIMGGLILLIIPGIIAALWFSLATQVVVLEEESGFAAMKRSRALMKGNIGKYIGVIILLIVLSLALLFGLGIVFAFSGSVHVANLGGVFYQAFQAILGSAILVVFYFSARCKNENFDLELLATSIAGDLVEETPEWMDENE